MKLITLILLTISLKSQAASTRAILGLATKIASEYGIDPKLAAAIIEVESNFNPKAVGKSHGEIGLFQLRPEFHKCATFKKQENIRCGIKYLAKLKRIKGKQYPDSWWVFYNVGPNRAIKNPHKTAYFRKVSKHLNKKEVLYAQAD
jgi:soluble lytic murein transglycosylase-like protein